MEFTITVPTIACEVCGQTITKAIQNHDQKAQVAVDVPSKVVSIQTTLSETALKNIITEAGHTPA
ncbi:heavy-metal-associated domain-containing protein [Picosynechococcus sp. PCC 8807]|uniref:heavy-metal-associated domain-containing protein n=1 Tax=Picosynechococcus sp. PCC 8807 TaxID=195248 RepID=UPI0008106FA6|nr:heavy-metal-associated domain-containing protein [Picosynechococcus sp. PCC 8807]ANV89245.1 heavy metal transporter [Picosynechococcus sp. PCC 8807]